MSGHFRNLAMFFTYISSYFFILKCSHFCIFTVLHFHASTLSNFNSFTSISSWAAASASPAPSSSVMASLIPSNHPSGKITLALSQLKRIYHWLLKMCALQYGCAHCTYSVVTYLSLLAIYEDKGWETAPLDSAHCPMQTLWTAHICASAYGTLHTFCTKL